MSIQPESTSTIDRSMCFTLSFLLFNTRYDHFGIDRGFSVMQKE